MAFEPHYSLLYIGTKNGELRVYPPFLTTAYIIPLSSLPPSLPHSHCHTIILDEVCSGTASQVLNSQLQLNPRPP